MDEPRINGTFTLQITNLPAHRVGTVGTGIFGCVAHISVDAIIPTAWNWSATTLFYSLFIPNDPSIVGVPFYNQCAFLDPLAQPAFYREARRIP